MNVREYTNRIILHHTLTTYDVGVKQIREWHKAKGGDDVGYHFVIRKDGRIEEGRELKYQGAYAKGRNADSIGIALAGDFSKQIPLPAQIDALRDLMHTLTLVYALDGCIYDVVEMHRDLTETNPCPGEFFQSFYTEVI